MLSTFDLTLLGSLVCAGGIAFLLGGKWLRQGRLVQDDAADLISGSESRNGAERSTALAGTRWLTVGLLTLFVAFTHGAEQGYLFSPWGDVFFHLAFVSACWAMTALRINRSAGRSSGEADGGAVAAG